MHIVVLDGYTLNPGDLSWSGLEALATRFEVHDRTPPADVVRRAGNAPIVLTNKALLPRDAIMALPELRYIGVLATGYNVVDVAAAREKGVVVTNIPDYGTPSVAQATFSLILELTNRVGHHAAAVQAGRWSQCPDFCFWDSPLQELHGMTLGLVGWGRIAQAVARIGQAFGMRILVHTRTRPTTPPSDIIFDSLEAVFRQSDVLSLHCPLTTETKNLIDAKRIDWMKPTALLINTGRGPLIDEAALATALNKKRIAGAALDVLSVEPPPVTNPLLSAKNCLITPHYAWGTRAARGRLMSIAVENVKAFQSGTPRNVVNG